MRLLRNDFNTSAESPGLAPREALHTLLAEGLKFPPEYRSELSNHLPMALHALYEMGADAGRMRDFFTLYARRFDGMAAVPEAAPAQDWRALRGQLRDYPALLAHFTQALRKQGRDVVLRDALPDLLSGVSAAAFHGLIRVGHGVESGYAPELAAGLAYWAWRWQQLPAPPAVAAAPATLPMDAWVAALVQNARTWRSPVPLISARMAEASQTPLYARFATTLRPAPHLGESLAQFAKMAVDLYVQSGNFLVLHLVTGLRALRVLLPCVQNPEPLQPVLTRAVVAATMAANLGPRSAAHQPAAQGQRQWPELVHAALRCNDDHTIKLVHACTQEAAEYDEESYLRAAELALKPD